MSQHMPVIKQVAPFCSLPTCWY